MTPAILIAVRGGGKSRLSGMFGERGREALVAAMLADMLDRLGDWSCHVVTPTPALAALARAHGAEPIADPGSGLNAALAAARAQLPGAVLALPGDLPLAGSADVRAMQAALAPDRAVVAPSGDGGTGGVLLPAGLPFAFAFGADSLARHLAGAVVQVAAPGLALDIDMPGDVAAFLAHAPPGRTRDLLAACHA